MANREKRMIRIEDCFGNEYIPRSISDGNNDSIFNKIIDASSINIGDQTKNPYSEGEELLEDPGATNGTAIKLSTRNSVEKILFNINVFDIPFGKVLINMRVKSSFHLGNSSDDNKELLKVTATCVDNVGGSIDSKIFYTKDFPNENYTNLFAILDYKGIFVDNPKTYLNIRIDTMNSVTESIKYLDYVIISIGEKQEADGNGGIYVDDNKTVVIS